MGGLGLLVLNFSGDGEQPRVQEPAVTMARQIMQPARHPKYMQPQFKATIIDESPWKQLAMTAVAAANQCGGRVRDVSMKSTMDEQLKVEMSSVDGETKEELSKVAEEVVSKARSLAGISAPMDFFDPLGFSAPVQLAPDGERIGITDGRLLFYREAELKHGRVCMLASLGILVGEQFHPLFGGNINAPSYIAFQQTPLQKFWPAVVIAVAIPEVFSILTLNPPWAQPAEGWSMRPDHEPGNLGFDPLGLKPTDPKEYLEIQNKELNNGRLAMIAAAGMIAQEVVTHKKLF